MPVTVDGFCVDIVDLVITSGVVNTDLVVVVTVVVGLVVVVRVGLSVVVVVTTGVVPHDPQHFSFVTAL